MKSHIKIALLQDVIVAPFAGAWIEIINHFLACARLVVAPFAGAWIEISAMMPTISPQRSLPSRERGLKSNEADEVSGAVKVAPFAGAWIEIPHIGYTPRSHPVAPFAGAWIEITQVRYIL